MIPVLIAYPQLGSGKVTGYPYPLQISEPKFRLSRNSNLDNMYPIKPYPINTCSNTYEDQVKYIEEKFASLNSNPNKTVYIHETCATDTNQIQLILDNVIDALLQKILHGYGLC
uniref:Uncharacterized protein n=1 Tax=Meloidogyne javanica TaxID=6303 RepID=A0A915N169_MELJA